MREGTLLAFLFVVVMVGLLIAWHAFQSQQRNQILQRIAQRYRGKLVDGGLFSLSQIRLRFHDYPAVLKYIRHGEHGWHTQFQITWPDRNVRCELYPQNVISALRKFLGMEDIEIGSPQFDNSFLISGNSRAAVRELLSAEVQAIIFRMGNMRSCTVAERKDVHVQFVGGVLTVTRPTYLSTFAQLTEFINLCAELFQAALATRESGITFVATAAEAAEPDAVESQCQICGEALAADIVYCSSCKTPHHRECWEYFGSCSTYACGQKQFLVRKKQRKTA